MRLASLSLSYSILKVLPRFLSPWRPLAGLFRFLPLLSGEQRTRANDYLFLSTNQPGSPPGWKLACGLPFLTLSFLAAILQSLLLDGLGLPVDLRGFEPLASAVQRRRSPS